MLWTSHEVAQNTISICESAVVKGERPSKNVPNCSFFSRAQCPRSNFRSDRASLLRRCFLPESCFGLNEHWNVACIGGNTHAHKGLAHCQIIIKSSQTVLLQSLLGLELSHLQGANCESARIRYRKWYYEARDTAFTPCGPLPRNLRTAAAPI